MSKLAFTLLLVLVAACGSELPHRVSKPAEPADWSSLPSGWTQLEPPPFARARAASVWTGAELFFWGGDTDYGGVAHGEGALYDPASNRWRTVPPAPIDGRSSAAAVWTDEEVLIWGGRRSAGPVGDGAAFDPTSCSWRSSPVPPSVSGFRRPLSGRDGR